MTKVDLLGLVIALTLLALLSWVLCTRPELDTDPTPPNDTASRHFFDQLQGKLTLTLHVRSHNLKEQETYIKSTMR